MYTLRFNSLWSSLEILEVQTLYEEVASEYLKKLEQLLSSDSFGFGDEKVEVKKEPGIYLISDKDGRIVYVGRTKNLQRRLLSNHRSGNIRGSQFRKALMKYRGLRPEYEITRYIKKNCEFKFKVVEDPEERIRLEHFATAIVGPELNVKLKQ